MNFPKKTINNTISFLQVMSNTEADSFIMPLILGTLDRITIQPGRSMKVIATIIGPIKKYVGKFKICARTF
jgi:hypothetical protein